MQSDAKDANGAHEHAAGRPDACGCMVPPPACTRVLPPVDLMHACTRNVQAGGTTACETFQTCGALRVEPLHNCNCWAGATDEKPIRSGTWVFQVRVRVLVRVRLLVTTPECAHAYAYAEVHADAHAHMHMLVRTLICSCVRSYARAHAPLDHHAYAHAHPHAFARGPCRRWSRARGTCASSSAPSHGPRRPRTPSCASRSRAARPPTRAARHTTDDPRVHTLRAQSTTENRAVRVRVCARVSLLALCAGARALRR